MGSTTHRNHWKAKGFITYFLLFCCTHVIQASKPEALAIVEPGTLVYNGPDLTPLTQRIQNDLTILDKAELSIEKICGSAEKLMKSHRRLYSLSLKYKALDGMDVKLRQLLEQIESKVAPHFSLHERLLAYYKQDKTKPNVAEFCREVNSALLDHDQLLSKIQVSGISDSLSQETDRMCKHLQRLYFHFKYLSEKRNRVLAKYNLSELLVKKRITFLTTRMDELLEMQQEKTGPIRLATRSLRNDNSTKKMANTLEQRYLDIIERLETQLLMMKTLKNVRLAKAIYSNFRVRALFQPHVLFEVHLSPEEDKVFPRPAYVRPEYKRSIMHPSDYASFPRFEVLPSPRIKPTNTTVLLWYEYLQGIDNSRIEAELTKNAIRILIKFSQHTRSTVHLPARNLIRIFIKELKSRNFIREKTLGAAIRAIQSESSPFDSSINTIINTEMILMKGNDQLSYDGIKDLIHILLHPKSRTGLLDLEVTTSTEIYLPPKPLPHKSEKAKMLETQAGSAPSLQEPTRIIDDATNLKIAASRIEYLSLLAGTNKGHKRAPFVPPSPRKAVRELIEMSQYYDRAVGVKLNPCRLNLQKTLDEHKKIYMNILQRAFFSGKIKTYEELITFINGVTQPGQPIPLSDPMRAYIIELVQDRQNLLKKLLPMVAKHNDITADHVLTSIIERKEIYPMPTINKPLLVLHNNALEFFSIEGTIYRTGQIAAEN